jgi:hypothetical protein
MNMEMPREIKTGEQIRAEFKSLDEVKLKKIAEGKESIGEVPTAGSMEISMEERAVIAKEILDSKNS